MKNKPKQKYVPPNDLEYTRKGLRCRNCGCQRFRVVYIRPRWGETLLRRRACLSCGARLMTWERAVDNFRSDGNWLP